MSMNRYCVAGVRARRTLCASTVIALLLLAACARKPAANTLVMIIESSPANLDPRVGLDAQSQNIGSLLFENLVARNEHLSVKPSLAESWQTPNPTTYIFHLHPGLTFCDGRPLTARDVKWSYDSLIEGKVRSAKAATYHLVDSIEAPDATTVIFHLKQPWAALLWNLAAPGMGVV